jgi:hypothetical protein
VLRADVLPFGECAHVVGAHVAEGHGGSARKIVRSQHHGSVGLGLLFEELTRCSLFNYFAQPHNLIYALIWPHVTPTFKIVHRCGADRASRCVLPMIALTGHFRKTDDLNGRARITVAIERYPATHHAE